MPRHFFGIYHWRRRFRTLLEAAAVVLAALALRRRTRSRTLRLLSSLAIVAGLRHASPTLRRLLDPPPWAVERYKYDALARELPLADADRLLDVGSGTGRSLVGLAPAVPDGCDVTALDVFDDRVILGNGPLLADGNAARAGLAASVVAGDAARLPVADASHDVVTACRVLHDLPAADARAALAEVRRVLRPGGTLGVLELPLPHDADADPVTYWRDLVVAAGFDLERVKEVGLPSEGDGYVVVTATVPEA